MYDVIVMGAGLYGCLVALHQADRGRRVLLVDREDDLLRRASYNNQARVHGGYHYPRSRLTGRRSVANLVHFQQLFPEAIVHPASTLYAIARDNSKVTPAQFEAYCTDIGTPLQALDRRDRTLFNSATIAAAYRVVEPVFNAGQIRRHLRQQIDRHARITVHLGCEAQSILSTDSGLRVHLTRQGELITVQAPQIFNCTYSGLRSVPIDGTLPMADLKHEITEMALIDLPPALSTHAITVMDGDFWSTLPFPDQGCHTLSHVGHTPHGSWRDTGGNPYRELQRYLDSARSRGAHMIRDAARYVPAIAQARQRGSIWEVKTVLVRTEQNDARPILVEKHPEVPVWHVLGGKIDNVFDLIDYLDGLDTVRTARPADNSREVVLS